MSGSLLNRLQGYKVRDNAPKPPVAGKLTRVVGLTLEAIGCRAAIGALCRIDTLDGTLEAEVVGFSGDRLYLMPSEQLKGVIPGARVVPITEEHG
ncbi:MAG: flagellum-specific ATP synthase FliI, partial [Aeromonas veronii]